jgi:hypothetical protein
LKILQRKSGFAQQTIDGAHQRPRVRSFGILFKQGQHLIILKQRDTLPGRRRIDCQQMPDRFRLHTRPSSLGLIGSFGTNS